MIPLMLTSIGIRVRLVQPERDLLDEIAEVIGPSGQIIHIDRRRLGGRARGGRRGGRRGSEEYCPSVGIWLGVSGTKTKGATQDGVGYVWYTHGLAALGLSRRRKGDGTGIRR